MGLGRILCTATGPMGKAQQMPRVGLPLTFPFALPCVPGLVSALFWSSAPLLPYAS